MFTNMQAYCNHVCYMLKRGPDLELIFNSHVSVSSSSLIRSTSRSRPVISLISDWACDLGKMGQPLFIKYKEFLIYEQTFVDKRLREFSKQDAGLIIYLYDRQVNGILANQNRVNISYAGLYCCDQFHFGSLSPGRCVQLIS